MSGELLIVVVPSFVALLVAVLGIFQDSLRLRLIGPRLKVHFEMSEPFVGTGRSGQHLVPLQRGASFFAREWQTWESPQRGE